VATKIGKLEKAAGSIQRRLHKGLAEALPASVQKSYFMLSDAERDMLNTALDKPSSLTRRLRKLDQRSSGFPVLNVVRAWQDCKRSTPSTEEIEVVFLFFESFQ
jgi:hypothetical protein